MLHAHDASPNSAPDRRADGDDEWTIFASAEELPTDPRVLFAGPSPAAHSELDAVDDDRGDDGDDEDHVFVPCPDCDGTGLSGRYPPDWDDPDNDCDFCRGAGEVTEAQIEAAIAAMAAQRAARRPPPPGHYRPRRLFPEPGDV